MTLAEFVLILIVQYFLQMKKLLLLAAVALVVACGESKQAEQEVVNAEVLAYEYYGDTITADNAVPAAELPALMEGKDELQLKLVATIEEACQKKGCWMKVELGDGQTMRVSFKDYAFFVPKNSAGREVIMDGVATLEETSVEALRHFAEDAGKSQDEIAAITEPKRELVFEATGVILK